MRHDQVTGDSEPRERGTNGAPTTPPPPPPASALEQVLDDCMDLVEVTALAGSELKLERYTSPAIGDEFRANRSADGRFAPGETVYAVTGDVVDTMPRRICAYGHTRLESLERFRVLALAAEKARVAERERIVEATRQRIEEARARIAAVERHTTPPSRLDPHEFAKLDPDEFAKDPDSTVQP